MGSSRNYFYSGCDLYACRFQLRKWSFCFPFVNPASKHDSHGFLESWFQMRTFLPELHISKLILDFAHDAMLYYSYCRKNHTQPFIDLNVKRRIKVKISSSVKTASQSVKRAEKCVMMVRCLPRKGWNFAALWPAGNTAAALHRFQA